MAEEKQVDFDFTQDSDGEEVVSDSVNIFCWSCRAMHPRYWNCEDCDSHHILWHSCCACCHSYGDDDYLSGCESCQDEWIMRHGRDDDSDAETVVYDPDSD